MIGIKDVNFCALWGNDCSGTNVRILYSCSEAAAAASLGRKCWSYIKHTQCKDGAMFRAVYFLLLPFKIWFCCVDRNSITLHLFRLEGLKQPVPVVARSKTTFRLLELRVRIRPGGLGWLSVVNIMCCQVVVSAVADHSSRGVLPSVVGLSMIRWNNNPLHLLWGAEEVSLRRLTYF